MSKTANTMDIVATILAEEQNNAISTYEYDGIELQPAEPVIMRNTLLLTIFRPCSFIILRAQKDKEIEYDEFQARVEMLFANGIKHSNRTFHVLGASSSLKDGKVWMATKGVIDSIHSYFGSSQEALAYLGIYTSNCHHGIWELEHKIKVVDDNYQVNGKLITGDGEGYIPRTVLKELIDKDKQIQVRFHGVSWIGKGTLHPYDGDEFIIPRSMIKGKGMPKNGTQYFLLGIRDIARELSFSSSWTLMQFFSKDTIESTIPRLNEELNKLEGVLTDRRKALGFLGSVDDNERFKLEAFLNAGLSPTHPYLTNRLKKHLKKRYRDLALGSAVSIKGYMAAIADINQNIICCKDKEPGDYVLTRYPIRDKVSFIKVHNDPTLVEGALNGSVYVSNTNLLQIDADVDGDLLAIINDKAFVDEVGSPEFIGDYIRLDEGIKSRKNDNLKLLPFVASEAVCIGNKVGFITYLINAAILNGKSELLPILSKNLQLEVQSLKWATQYDSEAIRKIADELEIVSTFRECKFNKKAFVTHVPDVVEKYKTHPLFIPYNIVKDRFLSLEAGDDLLSFRYNLPIHDYDISKHQSEVVSVVNLYNGWISDILESYDENEDEINDALKSPISFLEKWSASKVENRKEFASTVWAVVHMRSNGISTGSAAFHVFEDEILELMGRKPKPNTVPTENSKGTLKTLTAVGGYFEMEGYNNWDKLNVFRTRVRKLGRKVAIEVLQNPVDQNGKDFYCENLRLGSLPKDQFSIFNDINVGDKFDAIITQKGKAVYLHTM